MDGGVPAINFVMDEARRKGTITSTHLHCSQSYEERDLHSQATSHYLGVIHYISQLRLIVPYFPV
jgi:hypothetical protein